MPIVMFALICAHCIVSAYLTRRVLASHCYEQGQKRTQVLLLWFLPIFGVVLVWQFLRPERPIERVEHEVGEDDFGADPICGRPESSAPEHASND